PAPTGLTLVNAMDSATSTESADFNIQWNDQSSLIINGKPMRDYLKYYEVTVYDSSNTKRKSYLVTGNTFSYTFAMNQGEYTGR
ncbi:hypothetical protein O5483_26290, partial [Escherichia coli]|nr:hypothetical protein [Escherichia coli]